MAARRPRRDLDRSEGRGRIARHVRWSEELTPATGDGANLHHVLERTITLPEPFDLERTLHAYLRTSLDPTTHMDAGGFWRATRTPDGPATTRFARDGNAAVVQAWGPGSAHVLDVAPDLLGLADDPSAFVPHHDVIRGMHLRLAG